MNLKLNEDKGLLVSVGLPVYNGDKTLNRAINSLLNQTYKNIEIIISDNCSTDNTELICRNIASIDERIKYIRQDSNIGPQKNFQYVLKKSSAEFFMWAAHDDEWHQDFIKTNLTQLLNESGSGVSFCNVKCMNEEWRPIKHIKYSKEILQGSSILPLIKEVLSPTKYNFYIYGLFRKSLLTKYISIDIDFLDRWLLLPFILDGYRISLVDPFLWNRFVQNTPIEIRYRHVKYLNVSDEDLFTSVFRLLPWLDKITIHDINIIHKIIVFYYALKFVSKKILKKRISLSLRYIFGKNSL